MNKLFLCAHCKNVTSMYTLYSVKLHLTVHNVQTTFHYAHCTKCTSQCTFYCSTLYTVYCSTLNTVCYSTLYTPYCSTLYTVYCSTLHFKYIKFYRTLWRLLFFTGEQKLQDIICYRIVTCYLVCICQNFPLGR